MSGVLPNVDYHLARLTHVPVHISIGGQEIRVGGGESAAGGDDAGDGHDDGLRRAEDATHGSMIAPTLPKALEFFADKVRR